MDVGPRAGRAGSLQGRIPPGQALSPCQVKAAQDTGMGFLQLPGLGPSIRDRGHEEIWGLSRQWGCRTCWESCLGLGTLLELQESSSAKAKREGHLRNGCFVAGEGRKYFGGSICSQRSTVGTL